MMSFSQAHTQLVYDLVRSTGRDGDRFSAWADHRGVCVRGENTGVVYLHERWTREFVRHLERGYFDPVPGCGERLEPG